MFLLTDCDREHVVECPLRPQFREPIVERIHVEAAYHLRMQRQLLEETALRSDAESTILPLVILLSIASVSIVILAVVASQEPQFLHDRMVIILIKSTEVGQSLSERRGLLV